MDIPLKTVILLTLCALVNSASSDPLGNEKNEKIRDTSLIHKNVTLNITVCVPRSVTDNTKITSISLQSETNTKCLFSVEAQRSETKAPCKDTAKNDTCKTSPEKPELIVKLFRKVDSKDILVCSANITDENVKVLIDTEGREITVHSNKTEGAENTARLTICLDSSAIYSSGLSKFSSSEVVFLADVAHTWERTTTTASTAVPTTTKATHHTSTVHTEKTSHRPESTETKSRKGSSHRPETTTTTTATTTTTTRAIAGSMGESTLCRGPLSGLILLVLLPMFFYY